jgi:site-specific recombinase XerD
LARGKGRKERALPLWKETATTLRRWLALRGNVRTPELFLNARGEAMTRAGFAYILEKHVGTAARRCPSLRDQRASPHVLRHTCAMLTPQAMRDIRKVALWLGHARVQTTEVYVRADPAQKLDALEVVAPPGLRRGRFRPSGRFIASLRPGPTGPRLCGEPTERRTVNTRKERADSI